jgi:tetratricopeptide (TPR) repeat protein
MPPKNVQQALALATQHHQAGRFAEAEGVYRQVIGDDPRNADALHQLGVLMFQTARGKEGAELIRQAIAISPRAAHYHSNLGRVLASLGDFEQSVASLRQALALQPNYPEAWNNLGNALYESGNAGAAIEAFRRSLALRADHPGTLANLANALREIGQKEEAVATAIRAVQVQPENPDSLNGLGHCLHDAGRTGEAIAAFRRAIQLRPAFPDALGNLAMSLADAGEFDASMDAARQAIALQPDAAAAHFNLGLTLLLKGQFVEGFKEMEWRFKTPEMRTFRLKFTQPLWDGSELSGKRILLYGEQGLGDVIMFSRYAPLVASRGGRVLLMVPPPLVSLMQTLDGVESVISTSDPLPEFDLHAPLMSLPMIFGHDESSIPSKVPYLRADPVRVEGWKSRLADHLHQRAAGLAWAGNPKHRNDRNRSIPPAQLAPLAAAPNIAWVSLQKETASNELPELTLLDWTSELNDFADTAALIHNLDLVVTVDTAVAHLAGAMGKRTWLLLPYVPDWRWMLSRADSPWYPSMRIFRQLKSGDWTAPVQKVAQELSSVV